MAAQVSLGALAAGALLHLLLQSARSTRRQQQQPAPDTLEAKQQQQQQQEAYERLAAGFEASGLDLAAIADTAAWFDLGPPAPWPRRYASFRPAPLAPASVRLLVVPLAACCPRTASLGAAIAADLLGCLPPGCKVFSNGRQNLHITVFHFSHPADPRPDATAHTSGLQHLLPPAPAQQAQREQEQEQEQEQHAGTTPAPAKPAAAAAAQHIYNITASSASTDNQGAAAAAAAAASGHSSKQQQVPRLDASLLPPPHERPGPTAAQLAAEQALAAAVLAGAAGPITLQAERVLLASSGVLLLTWSDPSGRLGQLRQQLLDSFPGACSRQSNIIHTSLFRIVAPPPPPPPAASPGAAGPGGRSLLDDMLVSPEAAAAGTGAAAGWRLAGDSSSGSNSSDGGSAGAGGVQLSQQAIDAISAACSKWTAKVSGRQLQVGQLWWVTEEEFSTVEGPRLPLALGRAASEAS